jgi:4-diphosphocytidyl-2-C-methyl-D-erythritol kinase
VIAPREGSHRVTYFTPNNTPLEYQNDTVSRALQILAEAKISIPFVDIKITKKIPAGGGLGGGSSDAATVLKYLYERFAPISADSQVNQGLNTLALKIGSDVPFFLGRGATLVWGVGEKLKPVKLEPFAVLVSTPPFEVLTKEAYSWFDAESELTRRGADATTTMIDEAVASGISGPYPRILKVREIIEIMKNDLEKPVELRHPEIGILKKALRQWGALGSLMSGSGSSVYGVFRSLNDATTAREKLQQNFPSTYAFFACETLV